MNAGAYDGIVSSMSVSDERMAFVLVVRKGSPYKSRADFKGKTIGVSALQNKFIDGVITDEIVAHYVAVAAKKFSLEPLGGDTLRRDKVAVALRKTDNALGAVKK